MPGYRNGWRKGEFLIIDSESGMTRYSGEVKKDYTGERVTKRFADYEQPQDFIRPSDDPRPIPFSNPGLQDFDISTCIPSTVGNTSVLTPFGPANHLYLCFDYITTDSGIQITTDDGTDITTDRIYLNYKEIITDSGMILTTDSGLNITIGLA